MISNTRSLIFFLFDEINYRMLTDVPSDITIEIDGISLYLHKVRMEGDCIYSHKKYLVGIYSTEIVVPASICCCTDPTSLVSHTSFTVPFFLRCFFLVLSI